ncbi:MoaD/ThiS family protein [Phenylobacterium sp.]|uniref:MoaD/ThiS family protein n=1 Tax=Phenylobacterium sp. TaxID=1871053 RepID=UPI0035AD81A9
MAKVLLFGPLRDLAGWREREIDAASIAGLKALIAAEDARLGEALGGPGVQVALDQAIVRGDRPLAAGAEVAFLPPMSGG